MFKKNLPFKGFELIKWWNCDSQINKDMDFYLFINLFILCATLDTNGAHRIRTQQIKISHWT